MHARFNISSATNTYMPTHAPIEDVIRIEQPIRSILPSLSSDHAVWSISPEATACEASERMTANSIGALVVLSAQKLDGIIAQEDVREVVLQGSAGRETKVSEIMTRGVYYVTPDMTIDECLLLMASKRLRYLPVLDGSSVVNMISNEDLDQATELRRKSELQF
jgi:signal-transduction protein with cAMP-binding, CBS, and nucleotidyltransferase domain